jgi:AbrB family looped-hinge helix DNA binding protein
MEYITVSSKGQISIPRALRDKLRLRQGTRLQIEIEENDRIVLIRAADWRRLRGMAAGTDLLAAHEADKKWEMKHDRRRS